MAKKILLVLVFAAVVAGGVFAQEDSETMSKNTVTVDIGPTIIGAVMEKLGGTLSDGDDDLSTSGFGIAVQYERQLSSKLSVAGRFAYLGVGIGLVQEDGGAKAATKTDISSFSLEGHARYYPFSGTFFVDGMLGYARMTIGFSGTILVEDGGVSRSESISMTTARNYFKFGAKLGWRIAFGGSDGFTFEPSLGWSGGVGLGDTFGKQLSNKVGGDVEIDDQFSIIENFIFIGGSRVSLAFGWRF